MADIIYPGQLAQILGGDAGRVTRVDDGTVFTSRELEFIDSAVMDQEYQALEGDMLVASSTDVPYWYESITYKLRRAGGTPIWLHGAPTQIPNVDQDITEATSKFKQLAIGCSWTQKELDASRALNVALDTSGAADAVQVLLTKMDDVKLNGDLAVDMKGFFDDGNVPRQRSDIGFNTNFTPAQIVEELQDLVNGIPDATSSVEMANRLALASGIYDYCANTQMATDNSISILDQFLMNNSFITDRGQVHRMSKLRSMTHGGIAVGDVACAYNFDPNKARVNIVPPAAQGEILRIGLLYVQIWTCSISEVQHRKPKAASIITGLDRTS